MKVYLLWSVGQLTYQKFLIHIYHDRKKAFRMLKRYTNSAVKNHTFWCGKFLLEEVKVL